MPKSYPGLREMADSRMNVADGTFATDDLNVLYIQPSLAKATMAKQAKSKAPL